LESLIPYDGYLRLLLPYLRSPFVGHPQPIQLQIEEDLLVLELHHPSHVEEYVAEGVSLLEDLDRLEGRVAHLLLQIYESLLN
jgi:hypothetical protein